LEDNRVVVRLEFGTQDIGSLQRTIETGTDELDEDNLGVYERRAELLRVLESRAEESRIAISTKGGSVAFDRILLHRDVCYLSCTELVLKHGHHIPGGFLPHTLAADEYYMLGDNSAQSKDSRFWGAVRRDAIHGPVECIFWPPSRW
jgi:hypothetical protein